MTQPGDIARLMAAHAHDPGVQETQTRYRARLVERWNIAAGSRVLEIACGQGDTTAVLADAVGPDGRVTAVDVADPEYGAPVTLGESAAWLLASPLGPRLDIRLGCDLLDPAVSFPDDAFDEAMLVHGGWYFPNLDTLARTLARVRPWARRLRIAEWDLEPAAFAQVPHLLAVLIQGLVEGSNPASEANVRSPFSRQRLLALLAETGWTVSEQASIDTGGLQDAGWEIDHTLHATLAEADTLPLPRAVRDLVASQGDILRALAASPDRRPLPAYALTAERSRH